MDDPTHLGVSSLSILFQLLNDLASEKHVRGVQDLRTHG